MPVVGKPIPLEQYDPFGWLKQRRPMSVDLSPENIAKMKHAMPFVEPADAGAHFMAALEEVEKLRKLVAALQSALETEQRINHEHARIAAESGGYD